MKKPNQIFSKILTRETLIVEWRMGGSNSRLHGHKPCALPTELILQNLEQRANTQIHEHSKYIFFWYLIHLGIKLFLF